MNLTSGSIMPGLGSITALVLLATWTQPTSEDQITGTATYMSPGRMREVIANKEADLQNHVGAVALNRKGDLGRSVWLEWPGGLVQGPFLSVDCAQRNHYTRRVDLHRVVEVSADVAQDRGFYGRGPYPVRVWFTQPPPGPKRR